MNVCSAGKFNPASGLHVYVHHKSIVLHTPPQQYISHKSIIHLNPSTDENNHVTSVSCFQHSCVQVQGHMRPCTYDVVHMTCIIISIDNIKGTGILAINNCSRNQSEDTW